YIAVSSKVYPECGADADCNETIEKDRKEGKLKVHMADRLLYRHWTSWRDGKYSHVLLVDATTGKVVKDMTPGKWDAPTFSLGGPAGYAFSPDGKELAYVSNHEPDPASSTNSDIWAVPVDPGAAELKAKDLTQDNHGWDGAPYYSPDGRFLAYLSQKTPGYESDLFRIALYDRKSGTTRYLTNRKTFDNWVDDLRWGHDGRTIFFQAEEKGRNPLFKMDVPTGRLKRLFAQGAIGGWEVTPHGDLVYSSRTTGKPSEIYRSAADGSGRKQLTHFNQALEAEVDIRPAEEMWVKGAGDYKVQVFIVKPHGFDPSKKYPLILNVHGGPQQQWMDAYRGDWQVYPGKGYIVAFANPTGSPGFGQDFVDAISCDWGGRVFRDLMKVTDALEKLPYVDTDRMGAMGWSYGGYMMMWFEGHTTRFKAIAAMMGVYDLRAMYSSTEELWFPEHDLCGRPWSSKDYKKFSPSEFVPGFKTPSLVITGEQDFRVPYTQGLEYFTDLQKMRVPSRLVVFPKSGHWPSWYEMAFYYDVHLDWFHRWLGGGAAPWDPAVFARNEVFGKKKDDRER
ncbi:MAG: S9 family peptidase, partial [Acidobacteria bacterium]|nr:S9 family peptidase [Acidobacteriota bacterium]